MVTVELEKKCACFKRSDFESVRSFQTFEEAQEEAQNMCNRMNEQFCLRHNYEPVPISKDKIVIKMYLNG